MKKYIDILFVWLKLLTANKRELIIIDHSFNQWDWPFNMFGEYYNSLPHYNKNKNIPSKYRTFHFISEYARKKTTNYERLKYHNVEYLKTMTENEFFVWFCTDQQLPLSEGAFNILKSLRDDEN